MGGDTQITVGTNYIMRNTGQGASGQAGTNVATNYYSLQTINNYDTVLYVPTQFNNSSWTILSNGGFHSAGIKSDGSLWVWGYNLYGQIGDNTTINRSSPIQIGTSSWIAVATGQLHTAAITSNGVVWTWGNNSYSQLILSDALPRSSPTQIASTNTGLVNFASAVYAGWYSTHVITDNGYAISGGDNTYGQLGVNDTVSRSNPVFLVDSFLSASRSSPAQIVGGSYVYATAGENMTAAINSSGKLFTWGRNDFSQLSLIDRINRSDPVQIGASNYSLASATLSYLTVADSNNPQNLYGVGYNGYGQLGDGTTGSKLFLTNVLTQAYAGLSAPSTIMAGNFAPRNSSPVQIGTDSWIVLGAGDYSTLGLKSNNVLFAWGLNNFGQLGDSTTINKSSPVQIGNSSFTNVSAGASHNAILKSDGTGYIFGSNSDGQVGDLT
jgi:alpha-tubulin suppressor-like RCC1 family protein